MSTSSPHPPIPRQPIGATFVVAISILGAFAVIQFLAVAAHYYPMIKQQVADNVQAQQISTQAAPSSSVPTPLSVPPRNSQPSLSLMDSQKVQKLITKIDHDYAVGDFDSAMRSVDDLEAIIPGDPSMLLRKAAVQEQLGDYAEAAVTLQEALKNRSLPQADREKAEKKIGQLAQLVNSGAAAGGTPRTLPPLGSGDGIKDDFGLQPGATLGIVDAQLSDGKEGTKHLKVAVKARQGTTVNVQDVKIVVYFYESTDDGDVSLTESVVKSQWLSPPIDWANDEPEILDMQYTVPNAETAPGKKYFGYVIGVYYNKELQAFRSEPSKLSTDFPLPLYVKDPSNQ